MRGKAVVQLEEEAALFDHVCPVEAGDCLEGDNDTTGQGCGLYVYRQMLICHVHGGGGEGEYLSLVAGRMCRWSDSGWLNGGDAGMGDQQHRRDYLVLVLHVGVCLSVLSVYM
jgi:hypothetical protein